MSKKRTKYQEKEKVVYKLIKALLNYKQNTTPEFKARYRLRKHTEKEGWLHSSAFEGVMKQQYHHKLFLEKHPLIEQKESTFVSSNKNKGLSYPTVYRIKKDKETMRKIIVLFCEQGEFSLLENSDYIKDNDDLILKLLTEYNLLIDELFLKKKMAQRYKQDKKTVQWWRKETKETYQEYFTPENIALFYFFLKNKNRFKKTISVFIDSLSKKGFHNISLIKDLLNLSLTTSQNFEAVFNGRIKIPDASGIIKEFERMKFGIQLNDIHQNNMKEAKSKDGSKNPKI